MSSRCLDTVRDRMNSVTAFDMGSARFIGWYRGRYRIIIRIAMGLLKRFFRRRHASMQRDQATLLRGKLVSFMWKNCRKDVALSFDFYTNSRIGCCSSEDIDSVEWLI
jgi:hypothetical protein